MIANKFFSMDALIDLSMTKLFTLAERVCCMTSSSDVHSTVASPVLSGVKQQTKAIDPIPSKEFVPTIHFSTEDKWVEGELFG